jgi:WD40 repeat protein
MPDVFISYSRRDKSFVKVLHDALRASHFETWVDWQDIAPTTEWWKEIESGIESTHTFIFVISKDSIISEYCRKEIDHAIKHGKRLIPVLRRKNFEKGSVHPQLSQYQWVAFQEEDEFNLAFATLVETINVDIEYKKTHTRLEVRAIEWLQKDRDSSLLLRGKELTRTEQWLLNSGDKKTPNSTELQREFVAVSRKSLTSQQWLVIGVLSILLLISTSMGIWARIQQQKALAGEANASILAASLAIENHLNQSSRTEAVLQTVQAIQQLHGKGNRRIETEIRQNAVSSFEKSVEEITGHKVLFGHRAAVLDIAFHPKGNMLASVSLDGSLKIWNSVTGEEIETLEEQDFPIYSVAFSNDGMTLASGGWDGKIRLWELNEKSTSEYRDFQRFSNLLSLMLIDKNQSLESLYFQEKPYSDYSYKFQLARVIESDSEPVSRIAFGPEDEILASTSFGGNVSLWDRDGNNIRTIEAHDEAVNDIAFSPDGKGFATASKDGTVKIWDKAGKEVKRLEIHQNSVHGVEFDLDSKILATASTDGTIRLWENIWSESSEENFQTIFGEFYGFWDIAFSKLVNENRNLSMPILAVAGLDGTVNIWELNDTGFRLSSHFVSPVYNVEFSPNSPIILSPNSYTNSFLATANGDGTISLLNLGVQSGSSISSLRIPNSFAMNVKEQNSSKKENNVTFKQFMPRNAAFVTYLSKDIIFGGQLSDEQIFQASEQIPINTNNLLTYSSLNSENEKIRFLVSYSCSWLKEYLTHESPESIHKLDICLEQYPSLMSDATDNLLNYADDLAETVEGEQVLPFYRMVLTWNDAYKFHPESRASVITQFAESIRLIEEGKVHLAIPKMQAVQLLQPPLEQTINEIESSWDQLCRQGSLSGHASEVMFACEQSIAIAPDYGKFFDSRGIARVLTGDTKGAIADFEVFTEWTLDEDEKTQRKAWVEALEGGDNPFTPKLLESLR